MLFFFREQWFIAIRRYRDADQGRSAGPGFRIIRAPKNRFYADPFLFTCGGKNFLFFEDFSYQTKRAVISFVELDHNGMHSKPLVALEREYHLSYPFVFNWRSDIFMLPETRSQRRIELYRAVDFPRVWDLHKVLLWNVDAVDPTLLEYQGKFWLFVNIGVSGGSANDELFLFFSDSVLGPWKPHPKNPLVSDVRSARPAGRIVELNGKLIRPSQDSSTSYGYRIKLNTIEVLTETDYRETETEIISPDWLAENLGTHTVAQNCQFQVLDGRLHRRKSITEFLPQYRPGWRRKQDRPCSGSTDVICENRRPDL